MSKVEVSYDDFELLIDLYNDHCKGNRLFFEVDISNNLKITMRNKYEEDLEVVVFQAREGDSNYMPQITVRDRLKYFLERARKRGKV